MPVSSDPESEKEVYHDSSSTTSLWDSDGGISDIFRSLVNMASTSHVEDDREDTFESEELIQSDSDPWIKHLHTLRNTRFEQCVPHIEDKVT